MRSALIVVLVVGLISSFASGQTTWYVDDDNCPGPGDGSFGNPFCQVQHAIDMAVNGDTVEVQPGTYNEAIDLLGKAITLTSTNPNDSMVVAATLLDGTGLGVSIVTCDSGEGDDTVIDGLTITNGEKIGNGAGLFISGSSPRIVHCVISNNVANFSGVEPSSTGNGGGVYVLNGSAVLLDCDFSGNRANNLANFGIIRNGFGGGICSVNSSPIIAN